MLALIYTASMSPQSRPSPTPTFPPLMVWERSILLSQGFIYLLAIFFFLPQHSLSVSLSISPCHSRSTESQYLYFNSILHFTITFQRVTAVTTIKPPSMLQKHQTSNIFLLCGIKSSTNAINCCICWQNLIRGSELIKEDVRDKLKTVVLIFLAHCVSKMKYPYGTSQISCLNGIYNMELNDWVLRGD